MTAPVSSTHSGSSRPVELGYHLVQRPVVQLGHAPPHAPPG
jgi:hypothetical protein